MTNTANAIPSQQNPIRITADARETNSGILNLLRKMDDVALSVEQLELGDYLVHPGLIVERKDANDFAASVMDGRLFSQLALMCANHDKVIILLEGSLAEVRSRIGVNSLVGAQSYIMALSPQASMVQSLDPEFTAQMIRTTARHAQFGLGYEVPLRAGKPKDVAAVSRFMVEGLPGVGAGRAIVLLGHFGSPGAVFRASVAELAAAPGIGAKTAEKIHEALHRPWSAA